MARGSRPKIDLAVALTLISSRPGREYAAWVSDLQATFLCGERAAKDALAVLVRGGWAEARPHEADGRKRRYYVTAEGEEDLSSRVGAMAVRASRRLFSACSKAARRMRDHQERNGHTEAAAALLEDRRRAYRAYAKSGQPDAAFVPL